MTELGNSIVLNDILEQAVQNVKETLISARD